MNRKALETLLESTRNSSDWVHSPPQLPAHTSAVYRYHERTGVYIVVVVGTMCPSIRLPAKHTHSPSLQSGTAALMRVDDRPCTVFYRSTDQWSGLLCVYCASTVGGGGRRAVGSLSRDRWESGRPAGAPTRQSAAAATRERDVPVTPHRAAVSVWGAVDEPAATGRRARHPNGRPEHVWRSSDQKQVPCGVKFLNYWFSVILVNKGKWCGICNCMYNCDNVARLIQQKSAGTKGAST